MAHVHHTETWFCPSCYCDDLTLLDIQRSWHADMEPLNTIGSAAPVGVVTGPATMMVGFTCSQCGYTYNGEEEGFVNQQRARQRPTPAGQPLQNGRTRAVNGRADPVLPELTPEELEAERRTRVKELLALREELAGDRDHD